MIKSCVGFLLQKILIKSYRKITLKIDYAKIKKIVENKAICSKKGSWLSLITDISEYKH